MSALFAYLIAVALLLGGGYGALNWLAAPEPVKVTARAKPTPAPVGEKTVSNDKNAFIDQSSLPPPEPRPEGAAQNTHAASSEESRQSNRSAHAETTSDGMNQDAKQQVEVAPADVEHADVKQNDAPVKAAQADKQPAETSSPASQKQTVASAAPAAAAKPAKRPHPRQASRRPEKRGLALMTLRTIEFPDGRRVSQLIPYRPSERASAFDPDQ